MKAKTFKWLLLCLVIVAVVVWIMGQYDYARLSAGKQPTFARWKLYLADGGSVQYWGFGYAVTKLHELSDGLDLSNPAKRTFRVGYELDYWTPFVSRESSWFLVVTNGLSSNPVPEPTPTAH
jgi:hypothetical protein